MIFAVISFFAAPLCSAADADAAERENKIKIAYLYHFSQFTEWAVQPSVFNYCVYNDAHFSEMLKQAYLDKKLVNTVTDLNSTNIESNLDTCQLIFFPNSVSTDILAKVKDKPILSIGTQKNFSQFGGIIYLFEEDQKIHFFINNDTALRVGLKISSQLLSLSKGEPL